MRNLETNSNGNASRNCWTIHRLVGCLVTLKCKIHRRSWPMKKAVKRAERNSWDREEVHGCNGFSVVAQKGQPAFGQFRISRCSFHPAGDRSFRDIETKHEQLAVDARCSPGWILGDHTEDEISNSFEIGFLQTFLLALEVNLQYKRKPARCLRCGGRALRRIPDLCGSFADHP
jgi:hypothetical protein